ACAAASISIVCFAVIWVAAKGEEMKIQASTNSTIRFLIRFSMPRGAAENSRRQTQYRRHKKNKSGSGRTRPLSCPEQTAYATLPPCQTAANLSDGRLAVSADTNMSP